MTTWTSASRSTASSAAHCNARLLPVDPSLPTRIVPFMAEPPSRWSFFVRRGFDGQHGALCIQQDLLSVGSQDELAHRAASAQPDHDEIGALLGRHLDQVLSRRVPADQRANLVLDPCLVEPAVYLLELLLEAPGLFSVPVAAAVVGVDNDQLGRAQLGLGCCAAQCRAAFWFGNVSDDDGHLISWVRDRRWTNLHTSRALLLGVWFGSSTRAILRSPTPTSLPAPFTRLF